MAKPLPVFQLPYRIDQNDPDFAVKVQANFEKLAMFIRQTTGKAETIGDYGISDIDDISQWAQEAFSGTVLYRSAGIPTNAPVPTGIQVAQAPNGTMLTTLAWEQYVQGEFPADFILLFMEWSGDPLNPPGEPSVTKPSTALTPNTADAAHYTIPGLNPSYLWSFGIAAARKTESGLEVGPLQCPIMWRDVYLGEPNFIGTVGGVAAEAVAGVTTNFNNRNDRIGITPANPVVKDDGTAVDHTLNDDGSADISFEWSYMGEGDQYNIDGFIVYLRSSNTGEQYVMGTNLTEETRTYVPPDTRAYIWHGVKANGFYTFGVQAFRDVDQDITPTGRVGSQIVQPSLQPENPYRPTENVAFKGDIIGTIDGVSIEEINDRISTVEGAAELIANMLGGHVIVAEDAIYICDAETLETSTKIWKWGAGGFGYSDDGGETYSTAITADGTIVAALVAAGIVTADLVQTGVLQATDASSWFNLDTGHLNIKNKIYFDATEGKYVFDGLLSATAIEALQAELDVVISNTTITQVLYAEKGNIGELTVDQLDTSQMVANYLASDTSPIAFIVIKGKDLDFYEGTVQEGSPTPTVQLTDRNLNALYWTDATHTGVTTDVTAYPVTVYDYDLNKKLGINFETDEVTGYSVPKMTWGAGDENQRMKGYIVKDDTGLRLQYETSAGVTHEIRIGENGIEGTNASLTDLDIYDDGMVSEYDDGTVYDWSWVKDVDGKITSITNNTTSASATITWNAGNKPV